MNIHYEESSLQGLRVLDVGTTIAGPMAATLLADFGAEVIKVEHPVHGDPMRQWAPMKEGKSLWWKVLARNKKLITVDLGTPKGRSILLRLVEETDVFIENFRPGTLERWHLGFDDLSRVNPRIIMVRISGYGQTGPYASLPGYGTIAEAMSGVPSFTGFPENPPTLAAFPLADTVAATFAAMSAMFAIYHRDVNGTGEGQVIDVSLYEPLFRLAESTVIGYDQLGLVRRRMGNRMAEAAPRSAYRTSDNEWIAISASSPRTFERLAHAIERLDLLEDPRFEDNPNRVANADELDAILADWFSQFTSTEAMQVLRENDVVAGLVYDIHRIFEDPHYRAREDIIEVPDRDFGTICMQAAIPKFSKTPGRVRFPGLEKGTHNREVFIDYLGLEEEEMAELCKNKVI